MFVDDRSRGGCSREGSESPIPGVDPAGQGDEESQETGATGSTQESRGKFSTRSLETRGPDKDKSQNPHIIDVNMELDHPLSLGTFFYVSMIHRSELNRKMSS